MPKTETIHVAVEPVMRAKLEQWARDRGLSNSALIRITLRDLFEGRLTYAGGRPLGKKGK